MADRSSGEWTEWCDTATVSGGGATGDSVGPVVVTSCWGACPA